MTRDAQWNTEDLRSSDVARWPGRLERALRTKAHDILPDHFFAMASSECRETFIDGHHIACISLAQAVAEGISKYIAGVHRVKRTNDFETRLKYLRTGGHLSPTAVDAFRRVWKADRNTFHHLNPDVPTDFQGLEHRAEECIHALFEIESELFAYQIGAAGKIVPKHPQYWPSSGHVFLRIGN